MENTFKPDIENLPYNLSKTTSEQLSALTKKMRLPMNLMWGKGQKGVRILCGVVIYRHLNISQKHEVMRMIHATKDPKIIGVLTTKITDTIISPHWGLWSQSRSELEEAKTYYKYISDRANIIGVTLSITSFKEFVTELLKNKKLTSGGVLLIAVWVGLMWNESMLNDINAELENRKHFIKSKPY